MARILACRLYWISLLTIIILTGCSSFSCDYVIRLKTVERSPVCESYNIIQAPNSSHRYYSDELAEFDLYMNNKRGVSIAFNNKTEQTIKILWDEIVYVDQNGENQKVRPGSIKYTNGWYRHTQPLDQPLFPCSGHTYDRVWVNANKYKGRIVKILMPIVIDGHKYKYTFSFVVESVTVYKLHFLDPFLPI